MWGNAFGRNRVMHCVDGRISSVSFSSGNLTTTNLMVSARFTGQEIIVQKREGDDDLTDRFKSTSKPQRVTFAKNNHTIAAFYSMIESTCNLVFNETSSKELPSGQNFSIQATTGSSTENVFIKSKDSSISDIANLNDKVGIRVGEKKGSDTTLILELVDLESEDVLYCMEFQIGNRVKIDYSQNGVVSTASITYNKGDETMLESSLLESSLLNGEASIKERLAS